MTTITVIRSERVLVDGIREPQKAAIWIQDGTVTKVDLGAAEALPKGADVRDYGKAVVFPGLVDSHVHINDPGTDWEGFPTATKAAAAGGITTVVDMPLNSLPVTTSLASLRQKQDAIPGRVAVDVALLGGITPEALGEIESMVVTGGVVGFKSFMIHSGLDEFAAVGEAEIRAAMTTLRSLRDRGHDVLYMFHAELDCGCQASSDEASSRKYQTFLDSRSGDMEDRAIALVIALCREYGVRAHIVHLSSASAVGQIAAAQAEGVEISAETTYTYLFFDAENVPDGDTRYKCCPPIRENANRELLWTALRNGVITQVVSDHSPSPASLKALDRGDFMRAWGGIASLGLGLPVVWTAARARGFTLADVAQWMCKGPAELVRLPAKGALRVGADADLVVWDPDAEWRVSIEHVHFRHREVCPYLGQSLFGSVRATYLRGQMIYDSSDSSNPFLHLSNGILLKSN